MSVIKNVTFFTENASSFTQKANLGFVPDEAIVRAITYDGPDPSVSGLFLIKCSLANIIGQININTISNTVYPNTHLVFKNPINEDISFATHKITGANATTQTSIGAGAWSISIDFIKK